MRVPTLQAEKEYKPREIAELDLLMMGDRMNNESRYKRVLDMRKNGVLKARNFSLGEANPHYLFLGSEIARYLKEVVGVEPKVV